MRLQLPDLRLMAKYAFPGLFNKLTYYPFNVIDYLCDNEKFTGDNPA